MLVSFHVISGHNSVLGACVLLPELIDKLEDLLIILHLLNVTELQNARAMLLNKIPILLHFLQQLAYLLEVTLLIAIVVISVALFVAAGAAHAKLLLLV